MVIAGTSLEVAPSNKIPYAINGRKCVRLIANKTQFEHGFLFGERPWIYDFKLDSGLDVFIKDECDETFLALCKYLGWQQDLYQLLIENKVSASMLETVQKIL